MRYGGSFKTKAEAVERKRWILGELAARRVPDLTPLTRQIVDAPTLAEAAKRWQASRVDTAENTKLQHRSAVHAMLPILGAKRVDTLITSDVSDLVAELSKTRKRETVRKTILALGMILDHAGVTPNVARDKVAVRLPREERAEIVPPTAEHVLAVHDLLPARYRLPLLTLDATGRRLSELEGLTWGDVDEPRGRWRVSAAVSKTRHARWVPSLPQSSRRCSTSARGRIGRRNAACSRGSAATGSERRSLARVPPPASHRSVRTTCAIAGSVFCISPACRGRGSASTSGSGTSPSPPTRTATS
jgi:integrase